MEGTERSPRNRLREAGSIFGVRRSGATDPFRPGRKLRTPIAFEGAEVYVVGRAAVDNEDSGLT
jgi:hypothetical protein